MPSKFRLFYAFGVKERKNDGRPARIRVTVDMPRVEAAQIFKWLSFAPPFCTMEFGIVELRDFQVIVRNCTTVQ